MYGPASSGLSDTRTRPAIRIKNQLRLRRLPTRQIGVSHRYRNTARFPQPDSTRLLGVSAATEPTSPCVFSNLTSRLILNTPEQIHDLQFQCLCDEVQTRERNVHLAALEGSDLRPVKAAFVGKNVLGPALLEPVFAYSLAQTPLQLLQLHQQQFGGTLLKHILLIRRGDVRMRKPIFLGALFSLLLLNVPALKADKKSEHDWKTGKVLDSRLAKSSVAVGATTNSSTTAVTTGQSTSSTIGSTTDTTGTALTSGETTSSTTIAFANIRDNQLVILGIEFAYIVEDTRVSGGTVLGAAVQAIKNRKHGCRFIVGDDVKFWQDKAILHVIDADGKECKVDILRQERLK